MSPPQPKRIVFINSHPIQYHVPLYQKIARDASDKLEQTVWYLSDKTVDGYTDKQFGTYVKWDLPLLDGYTYRFIPNNSWTPSHSSGFFGLINWGLIQAIRDQPKSIIVVYGWAFASNVITLLAGRWYGHTICMRGDNSFAHEQHKNPVKRLLRWCYLQLIVVANTDYYLYVGKQNKKLFQSFGASDAQLVFSPHAVDNDRFRKSYLDLHESREGLKDRLALGGKRILLFVGKLYAVKRVMLLLQAYHQLLDHFADLALVYVGDGEQRGELEAYCQQYDLKQVRITGFINQQQLPIYYTLGDVFVMCSGVETWGLAVNEAMNFDLPLVLTDSMGCTDDLLIDGLNGYRSISGDLNSLINALTNVLALSNSQRHEMGKESAGMVKKYSYDRIIQAIVEQVPL